MWILDDIVMVVYLRVVCVCLWMYVKNCYDKFVLEVEVFCSFKMYFCVLVRLICKVKLG